MAARGQLRAPDRGLRLRFAGQTLEQFRAHVTRLRFARTRDRGTPSAALPIQLWSGFISIAPEAPQRTTEDASAIG